MSRMPLAIHDELLLIAPDGSRHDADICSFCTDWAMTSEGIPSGFDRLDEASKASPYGDVEYADSGIQSDGVKRYPIDTEAHARASWSFLEQTETASKYEPEPLKEIRTRVSSALAGFGTEVEIADAALEGGTNQMDTISKETHDALLEKALRDATEGLNTEIATLKADKASLEATVIDLTAAKDAATVESASLKTANETLNTDLDLAQVALKATQDEIAALRADIATKDEAARLAEIASARADQVRNLGLFTEDYVTEKSASWSAMEEASWSDRVEEWKAVKGSAPVASGSKTDSASALSGTRDITSGIEPTARRAVLSLS